MLVSILHVCQLVAGAAALPDDPGALTGMMPILHSPGLMMPGQLGPIRRVLVCSLMIFFTLTYVHKSQE